MASGNEEANKVTGNNETSSSSGEKLQVLRTEIISRSSKKTPLYLTRSGMRRDHRVAKIQTAFQKKRLFESVFAINLYFDSGLKRQLHEALNDPLEQIKLNPRITLTISPFDNQAILEDILKSKATEQETIRCIIKEKVFSEGNTLKQFHLKLCNALENSKITIEERYRPGSWVPCLTNTGVNSHQGTKALMAQLPYYGCGIKIQLKEYPLNPYVFNTTAATLLFSKVISECDHMLSRFSVPKTKAKILKYFPFADCGRSVDIQVWVLRNDKFGSVDKEVWVSRDMVLRHYSYMDSTYQIIAISKKCEEPLNLVTGDTILFHKLKNRNGFQFPYRYMMQIEKANHEQSSDSKMDSMEHPRE